MQISPELYPIILYVLSALVLILFIFVIGLHMKMRKFLIGKNVTNLTETLEHTRKAITSHEDFEKEMREYLTSVEKRLRQSVQNVETLRFNPFKGTGSGGNQSFATAFINEEGNGVVISGLYSRERMSIFSKPIQNYTSKFELTQEEQEVVNRSKKQQ